MSLFAGRAASLLLLAVLSSLSAQQVLTITGDLSTNDGIPSVSYAIELVAQNTNLTVDRTASNVDGKFEFRNVASGNYLLMVKTPGGLLVGIQEWVNNPSNAVIHIPIVEPKQTKPISGAVAAATLAHRVPAKARHEMNAAIQAAQANDAAAAQEHLLAAIRIDPDFSEAHTNLGAEYTRALKLEWAYTEFETALRLGPKGAMQYCNLAVAALALNRREEAELAVRQSLLLDSRYSQANFLLGRILSARPESYGEAIKYLKLAAPDIANANALLAQLYAKTGRRQEAIVALENYEQLNPSADREKVQKMILSLR